jgi:drug/metabolite transporter (DMT)-like permease
MTGADARDGAGRSPYVLLCVGVLCVSTGAILVRIASAPSMAVAFQRVFLASVLISPFAAPSLAESRRTLSRRSWLLVVASGAALALHFATWIASLSLTSVSASVLLVSTSPVFTIVLSAAFLGERPSGRLMCATAAALAGTALIASGDSRAGSAPLVGDLLALAGAATVAVHQVAGRGLRASLPLRAYVLAVWSTAAALLALLGMGLSVPLFSYSPRTYFVFLGLALVPTIAGHGLVNRSLRSLSAPVVGLFLLGEPVLATAFAYAAFGETPGLHTLTGGGLILGALAIVAATRAAS